MHFVFIMSLVLLLASPVMAADISRDVGLGAKGNDVVTLQQFLKDGGFFSDGVTGYFGRLTRAAVTRFQKSVNITPTGYVGPKTRAAISAANNTMQAPITSPSPSLPSGSVSASTTFAFIGTPTVTVGEATTSTPFGGNSVLHQISVDWRTTKPSAPVSLNCAPQLMHQGYGVLGTYWAREAGNHDCSLMVQDASGTPVTAYFPIVVPGWFIFSALSGNSQVVDTAPIKLGELSFANNATGTVSLSGLNVLMEENLTAPNQKGRTFTLTLRNGTARGDAALSSTAVAVNALYPGQGFFNTSRFVISPNLFLVPGETRVVSLWADGFMGPFFGGTLRLTVTPPSVSLPTFGSAAVYTLAP